MKKIFIFLFAVIFFAACETMYGPLEVPTEPVYSKGVDLSILDVADSSAVVKLLSKEENPSKYVTFMLVEGEKPLENLDSAILYKNGYKANAVLALCTEWSVLSEEYADGFPVADLKPNTSYYVYAVAASSTGIPTSIVVDNFKTSDKVAPSMLKSESKDTVLTITFDEPVVMKSGDLVAKYYALNTTNIDEAIPEGEVAIQEESIKVDGNVVTITLAGLPRGAFYSVDLPEGKFEDKSGNKMPEVISSLYYDYDAEDVLMEGCTGRSPVSTFAFDEVEIESVSTLENPIFLPYSSVPVYGKTADFKATLTYTLGSRNTTYDLAFGSDVIMHPSVPDNILFLFPADTEPGSVVAIDMEEGSIVDIYGNVSEEWSFETVYSYGYTIDDLVGTYNVTVQSAFNGEYYDADWTLAPSDDPEEGNVMFTQLDGIPAGSASPVYANFNVHSGVLQVGTCQVFNLITLGGTPYFAMFVNAFISGSSVGFEEEAPALFTLVAPGVLEADSLTGILLLDEGGSPATWYDVYMSFEGERVPASYESLQTATPVLNKMWSLDASPIKK